MSTNELLYKIALTKIENVGAVTAKTLISYCGSAKAVFEQKSSALMKIPQIGNVISHAIRDTEIFKKAEAEIRFIEKNQIKVLFYLDDHYPHRLKNYQDSPVLLYYMGNADLNADKIIAVVGTRRISEYGKDLVTQLIHDIAGQQILVVSGLAYGVDSLAHKLCLQDKIETIGVLGHGLDRIYPLENKNLSQQMIHCGGLLTEFGSGTKPDRENFPMRNRIVAGMSDAIIVIETRRDGGSMITAEIANSYNKDVFAFPGKIADGISNGCHHLIKTNKAQLIENATDLICNMNWDVQHLSNRVQQQKLFIELTEDETQVVKLLQTSEEIHVDSFHKNLNLSPGKLAGLLLNLEFQGIVKSLPGKRYALIN